MIRTRRTDRYLSGNSMPRTETRNLLVRFSSRIGSGPTELSGMALKELIDKTNIWKLEQLLQKAEK